MRSSQFCFPKISIPIFVADFEFYFYFNSISFQEALSISPAPAWNFTQIPKGTKSKKSQVLAAIFG